jgi:hypothetical protein
VPLIVQKEWFTKEDIQANPENIYVFGDNEQRQGTGGQAKACRGEPNTIGIRTKRFPGYDESAYWTDETVDQNRKMISEDFQKVHEALKQGKRVVFPADGFGTGLAKLKENAPATLHWIEKWVQSLRNVYEV